MRAVFVIFVVVLWLGLALGLVRADLDTGDMTTADKCKALRQLSSMYRGASLTNEERAIKAQMVAWYRLNCKRRRQENRHGLI